jgi:hypothetical protein
LSEAIVLGEVTAIIGEWIPFGPNQIIALNDRLGAKDRCQGGLFTSILDANPTDTKVSMVENLTQVSILDFDFSRFINFEAEINYPEGMSGWATHMQCINTILQLIPRPLKS